jgi:hypothetical protein
MQNKDFKTLICLAGLLPWLTPAHALAFNEEAWNAAQTRLKTIEESDSPADRPWKGNLMNARFADGLDRFWLKANSPGAKTVEGDKENANRGRAYNLYHEPTPNVIREAALRIKPPHGPGKYLVVVAGERLTNALDQVSIFAEQRNSSGVLLANALPSGLDPLRTNSAHCIIEAKTGDPFSIRARVEFGPNKSAGYWDKSWSQHPDPIEMVVCLVKAGQTNQLSPMEILEKLNGLLTKYEFTLGTSGDHHRCEQRLEFKLDGGSLRIHVWFDAELPGTPTDEKITLQLAHLSSVGILDGDDSNPKTSLITLEIGEGAMVHQEDGYQSRKWSFWVDTQHRDEIVNLSHQLAPKPLKNIDQNR